MRAAHVEGGKVQTVDEGNSRPVARFFVLCRDLKRIKSPLREGRRSFVLASGFEKGKIPTC